MEEFKMTSKNKNIILALGAESAGNFSVFQNGVIYFSQDFGDLSDERNFSEFKSGLSNFLKKQSVRPTIILSDMHPLFRTTDLARTISKKYGAKHIPVQHHLAHIFSAVGDRIIEHGAWNMEQNTIGIACDGTGYGLDEKIWGGEIFELKVKSQKLKIKRIGHLENQILIGGEMAIREPARLIISILAKVKDTRYKIQDTKKTQISNLKSQKDFIYNFVKKYYSKNEFELLFNQLEQNFNCLETSSTARILDAVSVLLGFSKNERLSKHGPVELLEKNSTKPYALKPKIEKYKTQDTNIKKISNLLLQAYPRDKSQISSEIFVLNTTFLFEYLIKNINKDKQHLAATAQKYIADGLWEICNQSSVLLQAYPRDIGRQKNELESRLLIADDRLPVFFAGGMANNLIMSEALTSHGAYLNKKIPRGDAGISFGQIFYCLLANPRD